MKALIMDILAYITFVCLSIAGFIFLNNDKLSGMSFIMYFGISICALVIFLLRHMIKTFEYKDLKFSLEQTKTAIYAKAEEVKMLGEEVAKMLAYNVAMGNRFVGNHHVYEMQSKRDEIESMLKNFGSSPTKIHEQVKLIDNMIVSDLFEALIRKAEFGTMKNPRPEWYNEMRESIMSGEEISIPTIKQNLSDSGIDEAQIRDELHALEHFYKTRTLL